MILTSWKRGFLATDDEAQACVRRGAAYLDRVVGPDWPEQIGTERLSISSPFNCMLSQLNAVKPRLALMLAPVHGSGFSLGTRADLLSLVWKTAAMRRSYRLLDQAWRRADRGAAERAGDAGRDGGRGAGAGAQAGGRERRGRVEPPRNQAPSRLTPAPGWGRLVLPPLPLGGRAGVGGKQATSPRLKPVESASVCFASLPCQSGLLTPHPSPPPQGERGQNPTDRGAAETTTATPSAGRGARPGAARRRRKRRPEQPGQ